MIDTEKGYKRTRFGYENRANSGPMNSEKQRASNRRSSAKRYAERRKIIDEIKVSRGCIDCGFNLHPAALQFDHIEGEKTFKISASLSRKWERILVEIAKCVVRCANCHAIKTVENEESKGRPRLSITGVSGSIPPS